VALFDVFGKNKPTTVSPDLTAALEAHTKAVNRLLREIEQSFSPPSEPGPQVASLPLRQAASGRR
jgi:hypothetical protein